MAAVYVFEGARIDNLDGFWKEMERAFGHSPYFGRNLDAFRDALRGGPGWPEDADEIDRIDWRDHERSRETLGYPETVRQLEDQLRHCHPTARDSVREKLEQARDHRGPTVFDWLREIIEGELPGKLRLC